MYAAVDYWVLLARLLMSSLFLASGIEKLVVYGSAVAFATSGGVPFARELMPLAIVLELGCASMLILGWRTRIAALILATWVLILGPSFHRFWAVPAADWQQVFDGFFHHLVMGGGFICLAACGAGRLSLDSRAKIRVTSA